jgi:subtilisin family serine protease
MTPSRTQRPKLLVAVVVLLLGGQAPVSAQVEPPGRDELTYVSDHVLVELKPGFRPSGLLGERSEPVLERWHVVPVGPGEDPAEMIETLASLPGVEQVALDYVIQLDPEFRPVPLGHVDPVEVNDPFHGFQWHFPAVQLDEAWALSTGSGVVVAVVDTGISQAGEDLLCHTFVSPYNAITGTPGAAAATDDYGHGTHVAGTVAQCTNNGVGVAGVAFDASLMPVKVLDSTGSGTVSSLASGIDWARTHGADVINMSLGFDDPEFTHPMIDDAIEAAAADGIVLVAASGNSNWPTVAYPASHPDVIAVGATELNNTRAFYSNRGSDLDLVAPGGNLFNDHNGDGQRDGVLQETFCFASLSNNCPPSVTGDTGFTYYWLHGTSMATPHVAGAAAILLSMDPSLDPADLKEILECSALDLGTPGFNTSYGHGLIQIHDALFSLTEPDTTPPVWPSGASLTFSDLSGTSVRLSWPAAHDIGCVDRYRIYRDGKQVGTTGPSTTSRTVSGLEPATSYTFQVRAEDVAGNLGPALTASVTTLDTIPPVWGGTAELAVERFGETRLDLVWDEASDNVGVTGYRLRLDGTTVATTTGRKATVTGLQPGTAYAFEVVARDEAGNLSVPLKATLRTARSFTDTPGHTFYNDILWMSGMDITRGCNPPVNDLFCPDDPVTRGQMGAFIVRALGLTSNTHPGFVDVPSGSTFAQDIGKLATAGITRGCNPPVNDRFCPDDPVTRAQMAAFVVRSLELTTNTHPGFVDVPSDSTFAQDIGRLATAGITRGCNPPVNDRFCPNDPITRGQLAAFFHRALGR